LPPLICWLLAFCVPIGVGSSSVISALVEAVTADEPMVSVQALAPPVRLGSVWDQSGRLHPHLVCILLIR
jgi:hypothetical protein